MTIFFPPVPSNMSRNGNSPLFSRSLILRNTGRLFLVESAGFFSLKGCFFSPFLSSIAGEGVSSVFCPDHPVSTLPPSSPSRRARNAKRLAQGEEFRFSFYSDGVPPCFFLMS